MLDSFSIFTRGGLVLWTFQLTALNGNPIDALIQTCLLQERSGETSFHYGKDSFYTLKWTFNNDLGLVFVAVYRRILQLLYVEELLSLVKNEFSSIYDPKKLSYPEFDNSFQKLVRQAEDHAQEMRHSKSINGSILTKKSNLTSAKSSNSAKQKKQNGVLKARKNESTDEDGDGKISSEESPVKNDSANGNHSNVSTASSDEGSERDTSDTNAFNVSELRKLTKKEVKKAPSKKLGFFDVKAKPKKAKEDEKKKPKAMRKWDDSPSSEKRDFSDPANQEEIEVIDVSKAEKSLMDEEEPLVANGTEFDGSDESDVESDDVDDGNKGSPVNGKTSHSSKSSGWFSSLIKSVAGKSILEAEDIKPALKLLKQKLMVKNVAEEIAEKLCDSVSASLVGRKQSSFTRISTTVHTAMEEALVRILTPKRSIDILRDVHYAREEHRPYVIVFVGVNGVGKSTNLAKVAYWLQQHDIKVMLAACDTFRSGAVEQLRTHARRLQIPLFEKGYEKDPAAVAKDAIKEATKMKMDAVLVDTAGRMQDNEPLMRALAKLVSVNSPDLVLFVGEALVGNDAVDQLSKFNQRLTDLSTSANDPHAIDGILLTKFDTIDDKVGAALSMVYISGAPIMFVGCGQTYVDLKKINIKEIVNTLIK